MTFNQLEKKDYIRTLLRAYFLQNGFNYGSYQGLGYADVLYPTLRKIHRGDDDRLQEALKENMESFNTNVHFLPFTTNLHLVMLKNKIPSNEIHNIKMALMRPLARIDGSLAQFCLAPSFATTGTSLTQDGLIVGPILFFVAMNVTLLAMKLLTGMRGYKLGTSIIAILSTKMEQISNVANMIGMTIISGLVINFVKISIPIQYVANMSGGQQEMVAAREMIDTIASRLLPVLFTELIFYPVKMRRRVTYRLVVPIITLGAALSVLDLIA